MKIKKGNILLERGYGNHIHNAISEESPTSSYGSPPLFIFEASDLQIKIENFIGRVIRNIVTTRSVIMYDPRLQNGRERLTGEIFSTKSQNQNE